MAPFSFKKLGLGKSSKSSSQIDIRQAPQPQSAHNPEPRHMVQRLNEESQLEEDDSIPQTEGEARNHIAKIRKEKGLQDTDNNTSDLQNALVM
jgi:hypothetical protein